MRQTFQRAVSTNLGLTTDQKKIIPAKMLCERSHPPSLRAQSISIQNPMPRWLLGGEASLLLVITLHKSL
jgi:hypothetical protein